MPIAESGEGSGYGYISFVRLSLELRPILLIWKLTVTK
jgi:hypothetical protein